ncbi:MAG: Crp/Fnr family transcriptional regulator, partial [Casimicrobium sp.]
AALPETDFARWNAHLEPCDMPLGKILFEAGCQCTHAYFPTTSIISMLYLTAKGEAVETAVAGCDGIGGLPLLTTGSLAPGRAIVRSGGHGFRLNASWLMQEFDRSRAVQQLLLRYMQAVLTQTSQIAVCNRLHSLEQQLSRWLLMSLDRVSADEILATQELIASSLGVRREGVTAAAGHLQDAGLISYRRGHISVLNREGLERSACECYAVLKQDYEALMPETALAT